MSDNDQIFNLRQGNQPPIKRITMEWREFPSHHRMVSRNRQLYEPIGAYLPIDPFSAWIKPAEPRFNHNLPNSNSADMHEHGCIGDPCSRFSP